VHHCLLVIDVDTRRRAACDLVRALCKSFEAPVIQIFSSYVQHMLLVCFDNYVLICRYLFVWYFTVTESEPVIFVLAWYIYYWPKCGDW